MKNGLYIDADGTKQWYINGQCHRIDGPAVEWADGTKVWWLNDQCHRIDGPAVEEADGTKAWYMYGQLHRVDGPAIERGRTKQWFLNGKRHRVDGPAVERADGTKQWCLNDIEYSPEDHPFNIFRTQYQLSDNHNDWTTDMKVLFKLTWGGKGDGVE